MKTVLLFIHIIVFCTVFAVQPVPDDSKKQIDKIWETTVDTMWTQSDVYWHSGEHQHIIRLLYEVIELDPKYIEAYSNLAWLLDSNERSLYAEQVYERAAEENPTSSDAYFELGFFLFNKKRYVDALAPLKKAVELSPSTIIPIRLLAHEYERLGDYKTALDTWDSALKINPMDAPSQNNRNRVKALIDSKAAGSSVSTPKK